MLREICTPFRVPRLVILVGDLFFIYYGTQTQKVWGNYWRFMGACVRVRGLWL